MLIMICSLPCCHKTYDASFYILDINAHVLYNTNHDDTSPVCQWRETIGWRTRKRTLRKIYSHPKSILTIYIAPAYALTKTAYFAEYLTRKKNY